MVNVSNPPLADLAHELGPRGIRVHAISPGPLGEVVDIMDVGFATACLATPYARRIPGHAVYVDGGVHFIA